MDKLQLIDQKNKSSYILELKDVSSTEEVFQIISEFAIGEGLVKDEYFEALIKREEEYPTGISHTYGIAIPHADTNYSLSNSLIVALLNEPVEFSSMGNLEEKIDVNIAFFIISNESDAHLEQLSNLMGIIQDEEMIASLVENRDIEALMLRLS